MLSELLAHTTSHSLVRDGEDALPLGMVATNIHNQTANGVLGEAVHRYYQGVLYIQKVVRFHGTHVNIISFMPVQTAKPSLCISHNSKMPDSIMCRCLILISP
jgi:hypothetical protein